MSKTVNEIMLERYGHSPYKVGESLKFCDNIDPFVAKIAKIDGILGYRVQVVGIPEDRPWMVAVSLGVGKSVELNWKYLERR